MDKVSIRLPHHIIQAFDEADGTRSALMRRRLIEAVEDGELSGVPDDLQTLAEREAIVDRGRLVRKRAKFRESAYDFFQDRWRNGATPARDLEDLAETWRREGALYGDEYLAFVEELVEWYTANWASDGEPDFPAAATFIDWADERPDDEIPVEERLADVLRDARENGVERPEAVEKVSKFHPTERVHRAARQVFGGEP